MEVKDELWGLPMKIPRLCNEPNQLCRMLRADQALKIAGHRRNKPSQRRVGSAADHHGCVVVERAAKQKFLGMCPVRPT